MKYLFHRKFAKATVIRYFWKHIDSETVADYKQLLQTLLDLRYTIQAIIIDGKRGLYKAFKDYPIQK